MTPFKPYLLVNRLVVLKSGHHVYDEPFHVGVNIIRGKNSSGKSTIADFIFYALGGELTKWKHEAKTCDFTIIEVNLSGKIFTLKREVNEKSKQGMDIFQGGLNEATASNITNWLRYPYQATEKKESFYQAILKELGIPFSKSDDNNSITLHQLLRLMYIDQMTSLDRLFKFDPFDSPSKRRAIGELMIGLSDHELYGYRVRFHKLEAQLDLKIKEIKFLHGFFGDAIKTVAGINDEISIKRDLIVSLEKQLLNGDNINSHESDTKQLSALREHVSEMRAKIRELIEIKEACAFEISDSQKFILSLQSRLEAIDDTSRVIHALSDIGFHYCPACFNKINHEHSGCCLCGSDLTQSSSENDPTFKIRKEIEFQISESKRLIESRQGRLSDYELKVNQMSTTLESKLRELAALERPISEVNQRLRGLLIQIGAVSREIEQLNESKKRFAKLHDLYELRNQLQTELNEVRDEIERRESMLESEISKKKNVLSALTKKILNADKDHEEIFRDGKVVDFDFGEDKVSIDDRVLFSASSMVYLKNAFRLALFQASCMDGTYIYPRFLLMDNVEDKGMQAERSHLFQTEILRVSSEIDVPHQIIYTTSMINPEVDGNTEYCIGEKYDDHNKTLKFGSSIS